AVADVGAVGALADRGQAAQRHADLLLGGKIQPPDADPAGTVLRWCAAVAHRQMISRESANAFSGHLHSVYKLAASSYNQSPTETLSQLAGLIVIISGIGSPDDDEVKAAGYSRVGRINESDPEEIQR